MVILSNTSSRSKVAKEKFFSMGFSEFDIPFVTSGELAWHYLGDNRLSVNMKLN